MIASNFKRLEKEIKSDEFMRNNLDLKLERLQSGTYIQLISLENSSTYMMQHFHVHCPQCLMEQQATAIPTWNIKRENVQYIFPKFNFVGENGTTTTTASSKK